jgi:hypothetical protein
MPAPKTTAVATATAGHSRRAHAQGRNGR